VQRDLHGVRRGGGRKTKKRADAARGRKERGRGGGGGEKKGADATRGRKQRSGCGARVEERAWRCSDDDLVVV